jgi:hypothetical protein
MRINYISILMHRLIQTTVLVMCTNYIRVVMRKNSINNGYADANKLYLNSHSQDYYKQQFLSCAEDILNFLRA